MTANEAAKQISKELGRNPNEKGTKMLAADLAESAKTRRNRWSYLIFNSGREVEDLLPSLHETEAGAKRAAEGEIDDLCPPHSPNRRFYRAEVFQMDMPESYSETPCGKD